MRWVNLFCQLFHFSSTQRNMQLSQSLWILNLTLPFQKIIILQTGFPFLSSVTFVVPVDIHSAGLALLLSLTERLPVHWCHCQHELYRLYAHFFYFPHHALFLKGYWSVGDCILMYLWLHICMTTLNSTALFHDNSVFILAGELHSAPKGSPLWKCVWWNVWINQV